MSKVQLDDAALTWTQHPPRPGRSVEVAGESKVVAGVLGQASWGFPDTRKADNWNLAPQAIICAEGAPWPCEWALALAFCESSFNVEAWATEMVEVFIDGAWVWVQYYFHGWFQIVSTSPDPGPLADPVYNTERAAWKYIYEGTGAWPRCPRNGGY